MFGTRSFVQPQRSSVFKGAGVAGDWRAGRKKKTARTGSGRRSLEHLVPSHRASFPISKSSFASCAPRPLIRESEDGSERDLQLRFARINHHTTTGHDSWSKHVNKSPCHATRPESLSIQSIVDLDDCDRAGFWNVEIIIAERPRLFAAKPVRVVSASRAGPLNACLVIIIILYRVLDSQAIQETPCLLPTPDTSDKALPKAPHAPLLLPRSSLVPHRQNTRIVPRVQYGRCLRISLTQLHSHQSPTQFQDSTTTVPHRHQSLAFSAPRFQRVSQHGRLGRCSYQTEQQRQACPARRSCSWEGTVAPPLVPRSASQAACKS